MEDLTGSPDPGRHRSGISLAYVGAEPAAPHRRGYQEGLHRVEPAGLRSGPERLARTTGWRGQMHSAGEGAGTQVCRPRRQPRLAAIAASFAEGAVKARYGKAASGR